jgi:hypothetical protein
VSGQQDRPKRERKPRPHLILSAAQEAAVERAPLSAKAILRRAYAGRSRLAAVRAMCLQCVAFVRSEAKACSSETCPLRPYSPYRKER